MFRDGTRFDGRHVQVIAQPAAQAPGRHGFVVSAKTLSRAVDRNRFRRLVREGLRLRRDRVAACDLVIRLKPPVKRADLDAAARDALAAVDRACAALAGRAR